MICKIITKQVGTHPHTWDQHLNATLWAYWTSFGTSPGFTPFHLVYGQEAILPIEVELASLRIQAINNLKPKEKLKERILQLELLQFDREQAVNNRLRRGGKSSTKGWRQRTWKKDNMCSGMTIDLIIERVASSCISGKALFKFWRSMPMVATNYKICQVRYITPGLMDGASSHTFSGLKPINGEGLLDDEGLSRLFRHDLMD